MSTRYHGFYVVTPEASVTTEQSSASVDDKEPPLYQQVVPKNVHTILMARGQVREVPWSDGWVIDKDFENFDFNPTPRCVDEAFENSPLMCSFCQDFGCPNCADLRKDDQFYYAKTIWNQTYNVLHHTPPPSPLLPMERLVGIEENPGPVGRPRQRWVPRRVRNNAAVAQSIVRNNQEIAGRRDAHLERELDAAVNHFEHKYDDLAAQIAVDNSHSREEKEREHKARDVQREGIQVREQVPIHTAVTPSIFAYREITVRRWCIPVCIFIFGLALFSANYIRTEEVCETKCEVGILTHIKTWLGWERNCWQICMTITYQIHYIWVRLLWSLLCLSMVMIVRFRFCLWVSKDSKLVDTHYLRQCQFGMTRSQLAKDTLKHYYLLQFNGYCPCVQVVPVSGLYFVEAVFASAPANEDLEIHHRRMLLNNGILADVDEPDIVAYTAMLVAQHQKERSKYIVDFAWGQDVALLMLAWLIVGGCVSLAIWFPTFQLYAPNLYLSVRISNMKSVGPMLIEAETLLQYRLVATYLAVFVRILTHMICGAILLVPLSVWVVRFPRWIKTVLSILRDTLIYFWNLI